MTGLALDPALHIILRAALTLLFLWAAGHKLRNLARFRVALMRYEILPQRWLALASILLVSTELGVALGLALPGLGTAGAFTAAALLALYAGAIGINLMRGRRDIDCGCAGWAHHQPLSIGLVLRNGMLIGAAFLCTLPVVPRDLTWVDCLTIVAGVGALVLLYAAVDGLLANAPRLARLARPLTGHVHA